jgi:hypothetical protein
VQQPLGGDRWTRPKWRNAAQPKNHYVHWALPIQFGASFQRGECMGRKQNFRLEVVTIEFDGRIIVGSFSVDKGLVTTFYGRDSKSTQVGGSRANVCFWHKADIRSRPIDVRFWR